MINEMQKFLHVYANVHRGFDWSFACMMIGTQLLLFRKAII